mgnify:FL=1|jgi:hypothetical protein
MKKIMVLIAFIIAPMVTSAQSLFDTLEDLEGVDLIVVSKDAFELLSKFSPEKFKDSEEMKVFEMIKDLKEFKMFSTQDKVTANKMETLVSSSINKQKLTQLMRIKEENTQIKIYVKSTKNKDFVSEVLMFIKGIDKKTNGMSEAMLISLTGNIDINKMSDLADTFIKDKK